MPMATAKRPMPQASPKKRRPMARIKRGEEASRAKAQKASMAKQHPKRASTARASTARASTRDLRVSTSSARPKQRRQSPTRVQESQLSPASKLSVPRWLRTLGKKYGNYVHKFKEFGVNKTEMVGRLDIKDMVEMGMKPVHAKVVLERWQQDFGEEFTRGKHRRQRSKSQPGRHSRRGQSISSTATWDVDESEVIKALIEERDELVKRVAYDRDAMVKRLEALEKQLITQDQRGLIKILLSRQRQLTKELATSEAARRTLLEQNFELREAMRDLERLAEVGLQRRRLQEKQTSEDQQNTMERKERKRTVDVFKRVDAALRSPIPSFDAPAPQKKKGRDTNMSFGSTTSQETGTTETVTPKPFPSPHSPTGPRKKSDNRRHKKMTYDSQASETGFSETLDTVDRGPYMDKLWGGPDEGVIRRIEALSGEIATDRLTELGAHSFFDERNERNPKRDDNRKGSIGDHPAYGVPLPTRKNRYKARVTMSPVNTNGRTI